MITEWTTPFVERKAEFLAWLATQAYPEYEDMLKRALEMTVEGKVHDFRNPLPDPERIHAIDDGSYQGTRLFVIGGDQGNRETYWYTSVDYGSCTGCDALEDAWSASEERRDYEALYTLTLHMLQEAKAVVLR